MIKAPIKLQDLRRKIYIKAKAEPTHRFWGIYIHVYRMDVLNQAYEQAKRNNGAPGIDGMLFKMIEASGKEKFLQEIQHELKTETYKPMPNRMCKIPKNNGKMRKLSIPVIKDRIVQGALKIVLESIFEADFQEGSYGYRPNQGPQQALESVKQAILLGKTKVIDLDIKAYFDSVRHDLLFEKIARRVDDDQLMHLLKLICKASGSRGVPQGGPISPLLANIFLTEIDKMLEKAKDTTKSPSGRTRVGYARFADDIVVLTSGYPEDEWLIPAVWRRLNEEMTKLRLEINVEKTKCVDLAKDESFSFLGFDIRLVRALSGKKRPQATPKKEAKEKLTVKIKDICKRYRSQPLESIIKLINPILRGWVNYFRTGNSGRCFKLIKRWMENKIRRHLARARGQKGFGWKRWSTTLIYEVLRLYNDYGIRYYNGPKVKPA